MNIGLLRFEWHLFHPLFGDYFSQGLASSRFVIRLDNVLVCIRSNFKPRKDFFVVSAQRLLAELLQVGCLLFYELQLVKPQALAFKLTLSLFF